ncbi:MAG TPA: type III-B CRISPR module RAMP protein Cmr1 [Acidobacteriota bacterium]|nr:type III-B CRISPR module RAMP protein Cmr1 [Acidobacteriota bacterium]
MTKPSELQLDFEVLTPLFLGGAAQQPELRPPSFKGLLRFWYRAVDPRFADRIEGTGLTREETYFGSSSEKGGQSPFLMRIEHQNPRTKKWSKPFAKQFERKVNEPGRKLPPRNGFVYLGFPFQMGRKPGEAEYLEPGTRFRVRCLFPKGRPDQSSRRALTASWWSLAHVGGVGSRSRRAFGSLALRTWSIPQGERWPEFESLHLLCDSKTPDQWKKRFNESLDRLHSWFGRFGEKGARHPHLRNPRIVLFPEAWSANEWAAALDEAGIALQAFRQLAEPDYSDVLEYLKTRRPLEHAPQRTAFGMPLTFRYRRAGRVDFVPVGPGKGQVSDRHPSLLFIRLVLVNNCLHPLFIRLNGAAPAFEPRAADRKARKPLEEPEINALEAFMDHLEEEVKRG